MQIEVYKMYIINSGTLRLKANTLNSNFKDEFTEIPVPVYLFETKLGYILFDVGCNEESISMMSSARFSAYHNKSIVDQLKDINIKPEDIKILILSHLHNDHIGEVNKFNHARIYIACEELAAGLKYYVTENVNQATKNDLYNLFSMGAYFKTIIKEEKEVELCKGLKIIHLGCGHSFSMLALEVKMKNHQFMLASDAIYNKNNIAPMYELPSVVFEEEGYLNSIKFLEEYSKDNSLKIIFGHDTNQYNDLKHFPKYYD